MVRNDGTFFGKDIGEVIVNKGDTGYITRIDTFLQRFYIYAVHFVASDRRVGMRARELCTLDHLNEGVCAPIGDHIAGPPSITDRENFDGTVLNSKGGVNHKLEKSCGRSVHRLSGTSKKGSACCCRES
ncbi:nitrogen fixation protein NifZ [Cupriavidus oxalaticus]|nr:nitrogen fixation protein NifZ [Cupriavidus taiwanensis]